MAFAVYENTEYVDGGWLDYFKAFDIAAGSYYDDSQLQLFNWGCLVEGGWNCTRACLDDQDGPKLLWNSDYSVYTLSNCLVYPYISQLLATDRLDDKSVELAAQYDIRANSDPITEESWPVLTTCLATFCDNTDTPGCEPNWLSRYFDNPMTYHQNPDTNDGTSFTAIPFVSVTM